MEVVEFKSMICIDEKENKNYICLFQFCVQNRICLKKKLKESEIKIPYLNHPDSIGE